MSVKELRSTLFTPYSLSKMSLFDQLLPCLVATDVTEIKQNLEEHTYDV